MKVVAISTENSLIRDELKEAMEKAGVEYKIVAPSNSGYKEILEFQPGVVILDITAGDWLVHEMYEAVRKAVDVRKYVLVSITKKWLPGKFSDFEGEKVVPFKKSRLESILKKSA